MYQRGDVRVLGTKSDALSAEVMDLPESESPTVKQLVVAAVAGDRAAWNQIVERFTSLVISTARRYRLSEHDVADVAQTVWLHLVEHLGELRQPEALPGWLVSTTRNECVRVIGKKARQRPFDPMSSADADRASTLDIAVDVVDDCDRLSRQQAVLAGFAELPDSDRRLLALLVADPPLSYVQISEQLNIPIGSIGPTRGRALMKLRATAAVSQLIDSDT